MSERMFSRDARVVRELPGLDLIYFLAPEFTRATAVDRILVFIYLFIGRTGREDWISIRRETSSDGRNHVCLMLGQIRAGHIRV